MPSPPLPFINVRQAEEESEESTEGAARRLSAGLSLRYESSGEHCPKYSQRELDIILNKRLDDLRITYEAKVGRRSQSK